MNTIFMPDLTYLWKDHLCDREAVQTENRGLLIPGTRGRIFSTCLLPSGDGLHPAVLFCHGFPGNEENMDVAHALRRIGFTVMNFHYSGSWGSDGNFSFSHCIEDAKTVLAYMLAEDALRIDPERVYVFGQSMGGFIGYHLLAEEPVISGGVLAMPCDFGTMAALSEKDAHKRRETLEILTDGAQWLSGTSGEALYEEACAYAQGKTFLDLAEKLAWKSVLVLAGERDVLIPEESMLLPWVNAIKALPSGGINYAKINTDHMYSDARCTVTELTARYLTQLAVE